MRLHGFALILACIASQQETALMAASPRPNDPETRIREAVAALEPRLIEIRRDLHAHPELAFEEVRTSGIVAAELERMGIAHRTGIGRTFEVLARCTDPQSVADRE